MTFQPKYLLCTVLKFLQLKKKKGFWHIDEQYVPVTVVTSLTSSAF